MRAVQFLGWALVGVTFGMTSCNQKIPTTAPPTENLAQAENFEEMALAIARAYKSWARVSDKASWAPVLCDPARQPSGVLASDSDDDATHGRKLYFLFAKQDREYVNKPFQAAMSGSDAKLISQPVGQAIVKESWVAVPTTQPAKRVGVSMNDLEYPEEFVERDGAWFRTGEQSVLFLMFKVDVETAGTDKGWVYAAVDVKSGGVLQCGRIESCMKCHVDAPFDRLFGLPAARAGSVRAKTAGQK